jgi:hypothetical protein
LSNCQNILLAQWFRFAPYQITLIWLYWYAEYRCWWPLAWSSELVISFLVHLDQRSMGTIAITWTTRLK